MQARRFERHENHWAGRLAKERQRDYNGCPPPYPSIINTFKLGAQFLFQIYAVDLFLAKLSSSQPDTFALLIALLPASFESWFPILILLQLSFFVEPPKSVSNSLSTGHGG